MAGLCPRREDNQLSTSVPKVLSVRNPLTIPRRLLNGRLFDKAPRNVAVMPLSVPVQNELTGDLRLEQCQPIHCANSGSDLPNER